MEAPPAIIPPPLPPAIPSPAPQADEIPAQAAEPVESPVIPVRMPEPMAENAEPDSSFEIQLGRVWLVRLGIALLVTGLALLGNYAYQNWVRELPAGVRLAALFCGAGLLIETGRRLAGKPKLKHYGEVILGGGLAFGYYCTFAAHHVERLRVIDSPALAAVLLLAAAAAIGAVSWLRQAKVTAVMAFALASYSTMLQPIGWLSAVSNVMLAAGGVVLMLRPGWSAPGVASLIGTYAAFFGWQILGAAQGRLTDPAVLWFLPPSWILFSLPGLTGRFDGSMSERARSWFTGANNIAFYLLFSGIWVEQFGTDGYWKVPAVFGLVLGILGVIGRRADRTSGGVNMAHGLAGLTIALLLKLEGFHLALALAMQSAALAVAFVRFKGRSEVFFSVAAGIAACAMAGGWPPPWMDSQTPIPVWSAGLVALFAGVASLIVRRGADHCDEPLREFVRLGAAGLFIAAVASGILGWCAKLPGEWPLPVAAAVATALGAGSHFLDRERRMLEVAGGGFAFLGTAVWFLVFAKNPGAIAPAGLFSLAAAWVWHQRREQEENPSKEISVVLAWGHSVFVALAAGALVGAFDWTLEATALALSVMALALTTTGLALRCHRLPPCGVVLALLGLAGYALTEREGSLPLFLMVALALAAVLLLHLPWARSRMERFAGFTEGVFRLTAFLAFWTGLHRLAPDYWGDWLAATALLLLLAAKILKWRIPLEAVGFLAGSVLWFAIETVEAPWSPAESPGSWRGWMVAAVFLTLPFLVHREERGRSQIVPAAAIAGCALLTVWATQMLVWRYDWHAAAVLWSVLGFAAVSAGLWQRMVIFRQAGFALLAMAIVKVFAVDVWDFTAFMRVVSFIVLGAALTLLGLFYNRFVPAMKRLLDEDETDPDPEIAE